MRLSDATDLLRLRMREQTAPAVLALIDRSIQELADAGVAKHSLQPGDRTPDFTLPEATGNPVTLRSLMANGPVILSFVQGVWCPFCCMELMAWQEALPTIQRLGASVVAISPQTLEYTRLTVEQHELSYTVLSDRGNQTARQFGLVYRVPDYLHPVFAMMEHPLPLYNGDNSHELPLTGTFVVDQQGSICYTFVDPDFTKRAEPETVIQALQSIIDGDRKRLYDSNTINDRHG